MLLVDEGKNLIQPVLDNDICQAIINILQLSESKGETYELGGSHQYTFKEMLEYVANSLLHRPKYINYSYNDFMKLYLSPNYNFEVNSTL